MREEKTPLIEEEELQAALIEETAELFKTLGDETRLRIINALAIHGELTVEELTEAIALSQSAVSHQLRRLKNTRVVKSRKEGKFSFYSLDDHHMLELFQLAVEHITE